MSVRDDRKSVSREGGDPSPPVASGSVRRRARPVDRARAEAAVRELLEALGFDSEDPALATSPARVTEAFADALTAGYATAPVDALGEGFPVQADHPVVATDIPLLFVCPHHLMPARGLAHVAFLPAGRVPGLSRLTRLVDAVGRRLVLQEDIAPDIVGALSDGLGVQAAVARIEAVHTCVAIEDFARRDAVFVTEASQGPAALVADLAARLPRTRLGPHTPPSSGSVPAPWSTSASEPPADPHA